MHPLETEFQPVTPRKVVFFKLGGTWDMVERDGKLIGKGKLR